MYRELKQQVFTMLLQVGFRGEQAGFEINRCLARFALSSEPTMQFKIGPVNFIIARNKISRH